MQSCLPRPRRHEPWILDLDCPSVNNQNGSLLPIKPGRFMGTVSVYSTVLLPTDEVLPRRAIQWTGRTS